MLVDSHCHLDFPEFRDDLDGLLQRAAEAGVGTLLTIGTKLAQFDAVLAIAGRYDNVFCTVGVHPHEAAAEADVDVDRLVALAEHPKVVGIGETGLDYFYDLSPRQKQQDVFRVHIEAARRTGLPLIVHTRDADEDMVAMLAEEMGKGAFTGLIHCFSSSRQLAEKAVELGLYISLSGIITFNKAETLRSILPDLPLDRLLVETDAPYLAPIPFRGKTNEPAYVAHTAARLAKVLGKGSAEIAEITSRNFLNLFRKVPR
jgi:TatD DNase family protein